MSRRLNDLHVRRGRLIERIATQRAQLVQDLQPVGDALRSTDRAVAWVQSAVAYVRQHPEIAAAGVIVLALVKVRRAWRWTQRGLIAWRAWRTLSLRFPFLRLRPKS